LVVVLVIAGLVSLPEQPTPASTSLALPTPTTSTTRATTTTVASALQGPVLGAGWENLDPGPIGGRQEIAGVWTGSGLFVWGGYTLEYPMLADASQVRRYHNTGFLWDPVTESWSGPILPPADACSLERNRMMWLGLDSATSHPTGPIYGSDGYVLLYGEDTVGYACLIGIYRPSDGTWREFGVIGGILPSTSLVWVPDSPTGPLLVAPERGVGYQVPDPSRTSPIEIPRLILPIDYQSRSTATRAFWTGDEIVSWGLGSVQAWSFGDDDWHVVEGPPVPDIGRDAAWTSLGLLLVNHQMAAAALDEEAERWNRLGDIPLRFYECVPEALAVAGTPVVRMCSGLAIWDEVTFNWIPVPLENLTGEGNGTLVGGDDAIYSIGPSFRRFTIERDESGGVLPPASIPIGVMQLDVPEGWDLAYSFAPSVHVSGVMPDDETIGVAFRGGELSCRVASSYLPFGWVPPSDAVEIGGIALGRSGDLQGTAYQVHGDEDNEWGILFAAPAGNGTEWVTIRCSGPDRDRLSSAAAAFGGLWSPWDPQPYPTPPFVVGPGWEEIDDAVDAGRLGASAAWTGEELFVWGGWDGDDWDPEPPTVYQGASLYDPETGVWRSAATPFGSLCSLTSAAVSMMGDVVLVRGASSDRAGCQLAATYDPFADSWTVLESQFFDRVPVGSNVVWTGEWLAAPTQGLAYDPMSGETFTIPEIPEAGSRVGSPTRSHWTGDRIVAVGAGDVFTLVPGEDEWTRLPGPPLPEGGRDSVWWGGWLHVVTYDNFAARFDLEEWEQANLPLRSSECDTDIVLAGSLPVARSCSGLAIWDEVRGFWVPIPSDVVSGATRWTGMVGSDDAIYSLGESFLRYQIERNADGSVFDPPAIPVGVMLLPLPGGEFDLRSTIGLTSTEWPDGSLGEVSVIVLDAPGGTCHVEARYEGPELPFEVGRVYVIGDNPLEQFILVTESDGDVVVVPGPGGGADSVWISCDAEVDEQLLAGRLWLPDFGEWARPAP
jgi:hypothetical protein